MRERREPMQSHRWRRLAGSRPVVGSSKKHTGGFPINEMATESLLFIPPLIDVCLCERTGEIVRDYMRACLLDTSKQMQ